MSPADWAPSAEYVAYCERMRAEAERPARLFDPCDEYKCCAEPWRQNVIPGCDTCHRAISADPPCVTFVTRWRRLFAL